MIPLLYQFTMLTLQGQPDTMANYQGKVLLIVNVASKCGFTPQYQGLEELYQQYKGQGLVVMGFPANNFMGQEPGSDVQIAEFCSLTYGVSFPMFSKISVKGRDIHPLYAHLTDKKLYPQTGGPVKWNFNKFLVGRDGKVLARFDSAVKPDDPTLVSAIQQALSQ